MSLLILFVLLAIGVSFLCSVLEAVLLSVTPAYVHALREKRPRAAKRLGRLKDDIDRPLAAILSLNTIAHTVGAAGAGAQASRVFGSASLGVFSGLLTLAILILSEIIPKTLGAISWRALAPHAAAVLEILIMLLLPLVWLSKWITRLITPKTSEAEVSREELEAMAEIGAREGTVEEQQAEILKSLFRFNDLSAKDVMTPRTVVVALAETHAMQEVAERELGFSRLPVYADDIDHVTGYVLKDDAVACVARGEGHNPLHQVRRDILTVPADLPLPQLFDRFLQRHEHIALVVDHYGGTAGVVTMEDVIETLLGVEIVDEFDETRDMRRLARERWEARARRLGLVPPSAERSGGRADTIRYGITGGQPPPESSGDGAG